MHDDSGVDFPLDRGTGKGDSLRCGLRAVGLAPARAESAASAVELAVVAGGGAGGSGQCVAAEPALCGPAARDFAPHEFGRDEFGDFRTEALAIGERFFRALHRSHAAQVLAMRDVGHFFGDYAARASSSWVIPWRGRNPSPCGDPRLNGHAGTPSPVGRGLG